VAVDVKPFSPKAIQAINESTGFLTVYHGAVRSGKTVCSELAWIKYMNETTETQFVMCGRTLASFFRNVLAGDFGLLKMLGPYGKYKNTQEGSKVLLIQTPMGEKTCYIMGASDNSAYTKLRGLTIGGAYIDEASLIPRTFYEELMRRSIVSTDRRNIVTMNPESPAHWFYTDYLDRYEADKTPGYKYFQFQISDNLAITKERREELAAQYRPGSVFYRRYILGERVIAEGLIYSMFNPVVNQYEELTNAVKNKSLTMLGIDYGTFNPLAGLFIYDDGETLWVEEEMYYSSQETGEQKTDIEYADLVLKFLRDRRPPIIIDPSAASFRQELRNRSLFVNNGDNDVLEGIRVVSSMFSTGVIKINSNCKMLLKELSSYAWDEKAAMYGDERPIKVSDHAVDALRYACMSLPSWRRSKIAY
jgi:PBSX family phage terminase large subunit